MTDNFGRIREVSGVEVFVVEWDDTENASQ